MDPLISYVICITPRCGSTLLCRTLESTGVCGRPAEYYWRGDGRDYLTYFRARDHAEFLQMIHGFGSTPNGVFGVKIGVGEYLENVLEALRPVPLLRHAASLAEQLDLAFPNPHYIWITRRNKVRQAISWHKALQTDIWHLNPDGTPVGPRHPHQDASTVRTRPKMQPRYHFKSIDRLVEQLALQEAQWQAFFEEIKVQPLTIVYEDFVEDREGTVRRILDYLGVPAPRELSLKGEPLGRMADRTSDEWEKRYWSDRSQFGGRGWLSRIFSSLSSLERNWRRKGRERVGPAVTAEPVC